MENISYLTHNQIDKLKWDECITLSPQAQLYANSFYLDIVSPNWEAIVKINQDKYLTVMPLPIKKKYGISFLHQPLFCQQLGLFSIQQEISEEEKKIFLTLVLERFRFIPSYQFNTHHSNLSFLSNENQLFTFHQTHYLSLKDEYIILHQNYSHDRKLNLRRALKANIQIIESQDIKPLLFMFEKDIAAKIQGGVASEAYSLMERIFEGLKTRKSCKMLYAKNLQGEITAGGLFAFYQDKIIYLFNAGYSHTRKENGRTLLIDWIIRQNANSSLVFDFESAEVASIAYFYKSFGSTAMPYPVIKQYNQLPQWINVIWSLKKRFLKNFNNI
ncbi:MAG: hypothetical protein MUE81_05190 [Thermoflexibacter sp.]|nr:hypothetical protein [Thermoflexibacter sp.]